MDGKKFINCHLIDIELEYGKPLSFSEVEQMFNGIRMKFKDYSNFTVEFYDWEGNQDYGMLSGAKAAFYGERIETDEEYEKRLKDEEHYKKIKIEHEKAEKERQKIIDQKQKEFDKQEFERLKKKYEW